MTLPSGRSIRLHSSRKSSGWNQWNDSAAVIRDTLPSGSPVCSAGALIISAPGAVSAILERISPFGSTAATRQPSDISCSVNMPVPAPISAIRLSGVSAVSRRIKSNTPCAYLGRHCIYTSAFPLKMFSFIFVPFGAPAFSGIFLLSDDLCRRCIF
ncbi:unknown [Eubacterium sp. CAG:115]|nr:unknown [Eubacterium sp. CAG:115]